MKWLGTVLVTVAFVGGSAMTTPAEATVPDDKLLIIGDSITARYNDTVGDPDRGWWSIVAEGAGLVPVTEAIAGSGMLKRGGPCTSTKFGERLDTIAGHAPKAIISAGGRNDFRICKSDGSYRRATKDESSDAIRLYMKELGFAGVAAGVPRSSIYAMCPWGTAFADDYAVIEPLVKKWALYYGLEYIYVGKLGDAYTVDTTHPNTAGNVLLADRVFRMSDLESKFLP